MHYIKKNVVSETLHTKYHWTTPDEHCLVSQLSLQNTFPNFSYDAFCVIPP